MRARIPDFLYRRASSNGLALALLAYSAFLMFVASVDGSNAGAACLQAKYMESFFCMGRLGPLPIPMFGGAFVGALAVINMIASGVRNRIYGVEGFGVSLVRMSLVLLIVSGVLQYFMRTEGTVVLREGVPVNMVSVSKKGESKSEVLPFAMRLGKIPEETPHGTDNVEGSSDAVYFERGNLKTAAVIKKNSPASFGGWTFYFGGTRNDGDGRYLTAVRNPARLLPWLGAGAAFAGMLIIFLPRALRRGGE